jgi:hypothetical protein
VEAAVGVEGAVSSSSCIGEESETGSLSGSATGVAAEFVSTEARGEGPALTAAGVVEIVAAGELVSPLMAGLGALLVEEATEVAGLSPFFVDEAPDVLGFTVLL